MIFEPLQSEKKHLNNETTHSASVNPGHQVPGAIGRHGFLIDSQGILQRDNRTISMLVVSVADRLLPMGKTAPYLVARSVDSNITGLGPFERWGWMKIRGVSLLAIWRRAAAAYRS